MAVVAKSINGKIVAVQEEVVVANRRNADLDLDTHATYASRITRGIYNMVPIIEAFVMRVARDEETKELYVYADSYYTKGSNNPNTRALMEQANEFNQTELEQLPIHNWDEENRCIKEMYSVVCHDTNGKIQYIKSKVQTLIIYGVMDNDLKDLGLKNDALVNTKKELVSNINTRGLVRFNGKDVRLAPANLDAATLPSNVELFDVLTWSPSNTRSETQLFSSMKSKDAFNVLNYASGDVLEEVFTANKKIKDIIKDSARLGILSAPAIPLVQSANEEFGYVVVMEELQGPEDYSPEMKARLEAKDIDIDTNLWDGAAVYGAKWFKAAMAKIGVHVTMKQAILFAAQTRANVYFTKVFGEVKSQNNIQYRKDVVCAMYDESQILRVPAGKDITELDRYKSMLEANKIANSKLPVNERLSEDEILDKTLIELKKSYKVIIVGNENCIGTIIDTNGGKLLKNISLQTIVNGEIDTYLLDIAKCSATKMSGQMAEKFLAADLTKTITTLVERERYNHTVELNELLEGDVDAHNCSLDQFILRYVEDGTECKAALESLIKDRIKQFKSILRKLKVEINAYFQRALFDDSYFLTQGKIDGILGKNKYTNRLECYSRDIEEIFGDEIAEIESSDMTRAQKDEALAILLTGAAFKYPSPSSDENALVTYVTASQLERRANKLQADGVITKLEADMVKDDFLNTSFGTTKIGPDNTIKHKLAGMDTDYDGIAVVFEKELVDILLAKYPNHDGLATIIAG